LISALLADLAIPKTSAEYQQARKMVSQLAHHRDQPQLRHRRKPSFKGWPTAEKQYLCLLSEQWQSGQEMSYREETAVNEEW